MHILLLGATGRTGTLVLNLALAANHTLTALARDPARLPTHPNLTVVAGTPLSPQDMHAAFSAHAVDAVISALNAPRASDSPFAQPLAPPMFVRDCVRNAMAAMRDRGVRRLVVMSAFGVGSSYAQLPYLMRWVFRHTNMRVSIEDHDALDAELTGDEGGTGVEWVLVRPARLVEGAAGDGVREVGEVGEGVGLMGTVSREGVAGFLVKAAEGEKGWRRAVVIAS